ncbi:MAG: hypothetical protein WEA04_02880 [Candidatus Andersenbacteria bacterium]
MVSTKKSRVYVEVAPAIPLPATSAQAYTYHVPATLRHEPEIFARVTIPFGRRVVPGVVVNVHRQRVPYLTKELTLLSPLQLTARQVEFAHWIHRTMRGGLGYTLRLFYPPAVTRQQSPSFPAAAQTVLTQPSPAPPLIANDTVVVARRLMSRFRRYLPRMEQAWRQSRQVLILVPEKWMLEHIARLAETTTAASRFALMHADLTPKQSTLIWHQVRTGNLQLIIGTQKAAFLPFANLGVIVIEEEFYSTHKLWDQYPRLHNLDISRVLAGIHHAVQVYATSFPSLRIEHAVASGTLPPLTRRPRLPQPRVIALSEAEQKQYLSLPSTFVRQLKSWVAARERIAILHNVRGVWQTIVCSSCHQAVRCPECNIAFTVHGPGLRRLQCHHCGKVQAVPSRCPHCHQEKLRSFGAGTEKIADLLQELLPASASLLRLDADTLRRPNSPLSTLKGGTVILGTTALFAALANQRLEHAVYLFPERGLLYPDFRSSERTYYTLVRLQSLLPARQPVVIVTRKEQLVADQLILTPTAFAERQLRERQHFGYPPVREAVIITAASATPAGADHKAIALRTAIEEKMTAGTPVSIRGPFSSFLTKRRGKYERHLLLLGALDTLTSLYASLPLDRVDVTPERIL